MNSDIDPLTTVSSLNSDEHLLAKDLPTDFPETQSRTSVANVVSPPNNIRNQISIIDNSSRNIPDRGLPQWKILLIILLILLWLITLSIPLSLDGYISPTFCKIIIVFITLIFLKLLYDNYFIVPDPSLAMENLLLLFEVNQFDPCKQGLLYTITLTVISTPIYILSYGYLTTGPPAFFPYAIFPVMIIIGLLLIFLWDGYLGNYIYFQVTIWLTLIDMLIAAVVPSMSEASIVLVIRSICTAVTLLIGIYIFFQWILKSPRQTRAIYFIIILLIIFGSNIVSLVGFNRWTWDNYENPGIEKFPNLVYINDIQARYLPIVSSKEYRYDLLPVGNNGFSVNIDYNQSQCNNYHLATENSLSLPNSLWTMNSLCNPIEVAISAQNLGYDLLIIDNVLDISNYSDIIVVKELEIPIITLQNNQSFNYTDDISKYILISRMFTNLWSYPQSYSLLCIPLIIGISLMVGISINILIKKS